MVFPNILALESEVHWRVPIDEHHTAIFIVSASLDAGLAGLKDNIDFHDRHGGYDMRTSFGQDAMALETSYRAMQGGKTFLLGRSDTGTAIFRRILGEQIVGATCGAGLLAQPNDGRIAIKPYMGGYLPSTSLWRDSSATYDISRWNDIVTEQYVEVRY